MTDDDDGTLALSPPFVFREDPSAQGPNAEHAKVVVGDERRGHLLRFPGVVGEGHENCDVRCDVEAKRVLQVFIILEGRCARFLGRGALAEYRVEPLRIAHGSRRQKQGVEETEYGGVCADSQRQHEHDRGRIKRRASEAADCLLDVARKAVQRGKAPSLPARLVSAPQASESSTSLGHRGDGAKTFGLEIASQQREVLVQFRGELTFECGSVYPPNQPSPELSWIHAVPRRTRSVTLTDRWNSASSWASCRLPRAVSL